MKKKEDYCVSRRLEILEHTGSVYRLDFQELQNFLFFFLKAIQVKMLPEKSTVLKFCF